MISLSFFDFGFFLIVVFVLIFCRVVFQRKHFLMILLSLELMMLFFFFFIFFIGRRFLGDCYVSVVLLCFSVCEARVGLSLLVSFIRSHGFDFISSISSYECF